MVEVGGCLVFLTLMDFKPYACRAERSVSEVEASRSGGSPVLLFKKCDGKKQQKCFARGVKQKDRASPVAFEQHG